MDGPWPRRLAGAGATLVAVLGVLLLTDSLSNGRVVGLRRLLEAERESLRGRRRLDLVAGIAQVDANELGFG